MNDSPISMLELTFLLIITTTATTTITIHIDTLFTN